VRTAIEEKRVFSKSLITTAIAGGLIITATPALASDSGLYGTADPTFDGVYRQSLSILALTATDQKVPASATRWLKNQQCADGGFMAYRADTGAACQAPDAVNFAGQDTNSTALAVAALQTTGNSKSARKAGRWLTKHQGSDGGWAYYPSEGATSDTNSTALVYGALSLLKQSPGVKFLRSVQLGCDAKKAERGAMAFDASFPQANDNSTSQAAWMLGGGLGLPAPVKIGTSVPKVQCKSGKAKAVRNSALAYLNQRLIDERGGLPYGGGYPGTDYAGGAAATLALANAGVGKKAVRRGTSFLDDNAKTWVRANGDDSPGSLAMLMLVADATGENPREFGGMNLPKRLAKSQVR
jgi:hypothetical protein